MLHPNQTELLAGGRTPSRQMPDRTYDALRYSVSDALLVKSYIGDSATHSLADAD